ncbi:MAG: HlyD family type I secretion periplasmic adaptor subunit [Alphaproteobacteria bacterium]|nr:HlyD family type I secretion periplasmic adaptor subunit [Alphaproteobacteria bacterium]MBV8413240.1 HlyD family type I secretion periplasmic adaptor subunit [Alphaproteobacteria bacterium]
MASASGPADAGPGNAGSGNPTSGNTSPGSGDPSKVEAAKSGAASQSSPSTVIPFRRKSAGRRRDEIAFLPAALEVVESPPSPAARAVGATVIVFFCLALAWASWGHVDIIASAQGKIIPSGNVKQIQPFENGVIRAIRVRDGQRVNAGDVLIELDPTMTAAELNHLRSDLLAAQLDVARLRAALVEDGDPLKEFKPPEGATPEQIETQKKFLASQEGENRAKIASLKSQQEQKAAERATTEAAIAKLEATIPVAQERFDVRKTLYGKELGAKLAYLDALQGLLEQQKDLALQKSRYQEATAALAAITESVEQTKAEYRRTRFTEFTEAQRKVAGFEQDLIKAEQRTKLQLLAAPIAGTVQQLAVHTIGGVVTAGQVLLVLVPHDSKLEIEATIANRDIGFVHGGEEVELKIDTFNFTRYGTLKGTVLSVSQDAVPREKHSEKPGDKTKGTENSSSEPQDQELGYIARISLDRTQMQIGDKMVDLAPGMAVTAEIKTGSRSILSYLISPLLKYRQDALHER